MAINSHEETTPLLVQGGGSEGLPSSSIFEERPSYIIRSYNIVMVLLGITGIYIILYVLVVFPQNVMTGRHNNSKSIWRQSYAQQQRQAPPVLLEDDGSSSAPLSIAGLPEDLQWLSNGGVGVALVSHNGTVLTMEAGRNTARFNPPSPPTWTTSTGYTPAPALVFQVPNQNEDWQLSAKVTVPNFQHLFDSGCLFGYHNPKHWVNLCFEYSPEQVPEIVSVVTRGVSDDANGAVIAEGNSVYLRLSRFGAATLDDDEQQAVYASHWSLDGKVWIMNRHFVLDIPVNADDTPFYIGFDAQAPTADSNTAVFSNIIFSETTLTNLRDGS